MKDQIVKKIIPVIDYGNPYFCVWLQEMSEHGLVLKEIGRIFATFEKATPMKRRYRTIYRSKYSMDDAEKALYEEAGWQLFAPNDDVMIAMSEDENASEPFTDTESYLKHKRHKWFVYPFAILGAIGLCVFWGWRIINDIPTSAGDYANQFGKLHALSDTANLLPFAIVFIIFLAGVWGSQAVEGINMMKFLLGKKIPDYNVPYNDKGYVASKALRYIEHLSTCMLVLTLFVIVVFGTSSNMGSFKMLDVEESLKYDGNHPVRLIEVDSETWQNMKPYISSLDANSDISTDYMVCFEKNKYIKHGRREQLNVARAIDSENDIYEYTIHYYSFYGDATSEDVAMQWLGEEASYNINGKVQGFDTAKILDEIKIDCDGVDYAGYVTTPRRDVDKYDYQHLYMRKGNNIQIVEYAGPIDLKSKLDIFANEFD